MNRIGRNIGLLALAVLVLVGLSAEPAQAWGRKSNDKAKDAPKAVNLDQHPSYHIYRGKLNKDHLGNWSLDKRPLNFNRNSRITQSGDSMGETKLEEGRMALVTAANIGGNLIVRRVTMVPQSDMLERGLYSTGRIDEEPPALEPGTPE